MCHDYREYMESVEQSAFDFEPAVLAGTSNMMLKRSNERRDSSLYQIFKFREASNFSPLSTMLAVGFL